MRSKVANEMLPCLDNWPIRGGGQSIAKWRKYGDSGYRVESCSNAAFVGWHEHRIRMTARPIIQLFVLCSVRSCSVFSSQSENFDSSGIFWVFVLSLILLLDHRVSGHQCFGLTLTADGSRGIVSLFAARIVWDHITIPQMLDSNSKFQSSHAGIKKYLL